MAFQMYLETVSWSTQGWRGAIRREVLDYASHIGGFGWAKQSACNSRAVWERTWSLLAPLMEPLVQAQARRLCRSDRTCRRMRWPRTAAGTAWTDRPV